MIDEKIDEFVRFVNDFISTARKPVWERSIRNRLDTTLTPTELASLLQFQLKTLPELPAAIKRTRDFLENVVVCTDKPRVHKRHVTGSTKHGELHVKPTVWLEYKGKRRTIDRPFRMDVQNNNMSVPTKSIPYMLQEKDLMISVGVSHFNQQIFNLVFDDVLLSRWLNLQAQVAEELIKQVSIESMEEATRLYRHTKSGKDRKGFQEKLAESIRRLPQVRAMDPKVLLEVMRLDPKELEEFAKFARRNRADLEIVSPDDIQEVIHILTVSDVLES